MDSKIIRTVNGHFADPRSTRDLSHISHEELEHIRMSCEAGMMEAETCMEMGDDELMATLERNIRTIREAGLPCPDEVPCEVVELREYFGIRRRAIGSFLQKLAQARKGAIRGITPVEYEHLVTSLQAGYREAEVCCLSSNGLIQEALERVGEARRRLGLDFQNPYATYCRDWLEFFLERAEVLWDVLRRVNQPYQMEIHQDHVPGLG